MRLLLPLLLLLTLLVRPTAAQVHTSPLTGASAVPAAIGDTANLDAFSRLRTSNAVTLFDSQFQYDLQPLIWEPVVVNAATVAHAPITSSATLSVTATATDAATLQTYQYFRYQPGKSQLVVMTFVLGAATSNITKRVGYFDNSNGLFLEQTGTGLSVVRRNAGTDTAVAQANWNLDRLDGTGPSGITFDPTKAHILFLDFQWLGVGRVRFGFDLGGEVVYVHEMNHANVLAIPYLQTANLPLRYQILKTGAAGAGSLMAICAMVASEGGFETERGYAFGVAASTARTTATRRALLSIRPRATFGTAALASRGFYFVEGLDVALEGAGTVLVELVYHPTFTGTPTWANANTTHSQMEYSEHGDAAAGAITGGVVIGSFLVSAGGVGAGIRNTFTSSVAVRYPLSLDYAGTGPRAYALVVTTLVGSPTARAVMDWREIR